MLNLVAVFTSSSHNHQDHVGKIYANKLYYVVVERPKTVGEWELE
jgi:hypothetical protein